jgi:hypothetical protein
MTRRRYKNPRYEGPMSEAERNGYEVHTRGWPDCLLTKPGEEVRAMFIGSDIKKHHRDKPLVGFTKKQIKMMELFEKMGARVIRVRP